MATAASITEEKTSFIPNLFIFYNKKVIFYLHKGDISFNDFALSLVCYL